MGDELKSMVPKLVNKNENELMEWLSKALDDANRFKSIPIASFQQLSLIDFISQL